MSFRVATWNVHNFFDAVCDSRQCQGPDHHFEQLPTEPQYRARVQQTAAAIQQLNADIMLLQEIENQAVLDDLHAKLPRYTTAHVGEFDGPHVSDTDVALLARWPLLALKTHRQDPIAHRSHHRPMRFTRELLEAHFDVHGRRVIVLVAHYKAKRNDHPERRLAEAHATARILGNLQHTFPEALVILGGDLNDTPGSPTLRALEAAQLYRVATDLGPHRDATYVFHSHSHSHSHRHRHRHRQEHNQAIDHLYIPRSQKSAYIAGSSQVFRTDGQRNHGYANSDHAALAADFGW